MKKDKTPEERVSIHALVRVRPLTTFSLKLEYSFNPRTRESATFEGAMEFIKGGVSIHALVRVRPSKKP